MIKYSDADDIKEKVRRIVFVLELDHVNLNRIAFIRSDGSAAEGTIARCHALSRIMQKGLECKPFYIIEVISEQFDKMSEEEKTKTLIHELLHIPRAFGGGFRHHDFVDDRMVNRFYRQFLKNSAQNQEFS